METNQITHEILDAAYKVHTNLGPGLLEFIIPSLFDLRIKKERVESRIRKRIAFNL